MKKQSQWTRISQEDNEAVTLTHLGDNKAVMVKVYDLEALRIFSLPQGHDYLPTPVPKRVVIRKFKDAREPHSMMKYTCTRCPYITTCKRILDKHSKSHPRPVTANNVKCPHCSFTTSKMQYLKVHSQMHNKERPYKCIYCEVWTKSLLGLADHYKLDHGIGKSKVAQNKAYALGSE